jgi:hypothetical protein
VASGSCHLVFIMCSLHHMADEVIAAMLAEVRRIVFRGGGARVMLKEHDCDGEATRRIIEIEHELFHAQTVACTRMSGGGDKDALDARADAERYREATVYNFKTCDEWTALFVTAGFRLCEHRSRTLDPLPKDQEANVSRLYWSVFEPLD